jgi:hypothetical protein
VRNIADDLRLHIDPPTLAVALENTFTEEDFAMSVGEGGVLHRAAVLDVVVDGAK